MALFFHLVHSREASFNQTLASDTLHDSNDYWPFLIIHALTKVLRLSRRIFLAVKYVNESIGPCTVRVLIVYGGVSPCVHETRPMVLLSRADEFVDGLS